MRNPLSKLTTFFCIVMFVVLASACGGPSSTPTQTLTDYCSALKNADYQTAYAAVTAFLVRLRATRDIDGIGISEFPVGADETKIPRD